MFFFKAQYAGKQGTYVLYKTEQTLFETHPVPKLTGTPQLERN
jgi:hypothetical protein